MVSKHSKVCSYHPIQHMASPPPKRTNLLELGNDLFIPEEEVILNILVRLPVKSLFRFKSVCKIWRKLISDDKYFTQLYNDVSSMKNPMVLFRETTFSKHTFACVNSSGCLSEISLDFLNDDVEVRASCKGLLCCSSNTKIHMLCMSAIH